jgi:hypothetical protein
MSRRKRPQRDRDSSPEEKHDYAVGYGRPPVHTRFKPGQSGNPKGRRKGSKSPKALLEEALARPITIMEGGRRRTITQGQALIMAQMAQALKGDLRAANSIFKLMIHFGLTAADGEAIRPIVIELTESDLRLCGLNGLPPRPTGR